MVSAVNNLTTILSTPSSLLAVGGKITSASTPIPTSALLPDTFDTQVAEIAQSFTPAVSNTLGLLSTVTADSVLLAQAATFREAASTSIFDFTRTADALQKSASLFSYQPKAVDAFA